MVFSLTFGLVCLPGPSCLSGIDGTGGDVDARDDDAVGDDDDLMPDDDVADDDDDTACDDDTGGPVEPMPTIWLIPTQLSYPQLPEGATVSRNVRLENVGTDVLYIVDLTLEGSASFTYDDSDTNMVLAPEQSTTLKVTYTSHAGEEIEGWLWVESNDPCRPLASVYLWIGMWDYYT